MERSFVHFFSSFFRRRMRTPPFKKKSRCFILSRIQHKGGIFYKRQRLNVCIKDAPFRLEENTHRFCFLFSFFSFFFFSNVALERRARRDEMRCEMFEGRFLLPRENPTFTCRTHESKINNF